MASILVPCLPLIGSVVCSCVDEAVTYSTLEKFDISRQTEHLMRDEWWDYACCTRMPVQEKQNTWPHAITQYWSVSGSWHTGHASGLLGVCIRRSVREIGQSAAAHGQLLLPLCNVALMLQPIRGYLCCPDVHRAHAGLVVVSS